MSVDTEFFAGASLADLARSSRSRLLRYFSRRGIKGADAEDAIQDVFARLSRAVRFSSRAHLEGYLFDTASSVAVDYSRRGKARSAALHEAFEDEHHCPRPGPDQDLIHRQTLELVVEALRELPEKTRDIFILVRLEGCAYAEISNRYRVSVSAIEKHMVKATRHLASRLRGTQS